MAMVPLRIKGFFLDHDRMPVAVLSDSAGLRVLPVWVGPSEASAIITELEEIRTSRPVAYDIFAQYFQRHGFVMDSLEIYADAGEQGYCARIRYHQGRRHYRMEVRPSDGLALAVRLKAPILAARTLLSTSDFHSLVGFLHDPRNGLPLSWSAGPEADSASGHQEPTPPLN
jgi:bifunctional DNase/RNase